MYRIAAFRQVGAVETFLASVPAVVVLPLLAINPALSGVSHAWRRKSSRDEHGADVLAHGVSPSGIEFDGFTADFARIRFLNGLQCNRPAECRLKKGDRFGCFGSIVISIALSVLLISCEGCSAGTSF